MKKNLILLSLVTIFFASCQTDLKPASSAKKTSTSQVISNNGDVLIKPEALKQLLEAQKGKYIFLNLWATWCPPCIKELPDLQKFQEAHPDDVKVIALSFDDRDTGVKEVTKFFAEKKIGLPALVLDSTNPDKELQFLDNALPQEIPVTYIFDKEGKPLRRLIGDYTFEEFNALLEEAKHL